jgi:hypothetical protein
MQLNSHGKELNTSETQENSNKNEKKFYILAYKIINQKLLYCSLANHFPGVLYEGKQNTTYADHIHLLVT